jgi:hypothetical protein
MTTNGGADGSKAFQNFSKNKTKGTNLYHISFLHFKVVFFFPVFIFVEMFSSMNEANVIWLFLVVKNLNFMSETRFFFKKFIDILTNFNFISKIEFNQLSFLTILSLTSISFTKLDLFSFCF